MKPTSIRLPTDQKEPTMSRLASVFAKFQAAVGPALHTAAVTAVEAAHTAALEMLQPSPPAVPAAEMPMAPAPAVPKLVARTTGEPPRIVFRTVDRSGRIDTSSLRGVLDTVLPRNAFAAVRALGFKVQAAPPVLPFRAFLDLNTGILWVSFEEGEGDEQIDASVRAELERVLRPHADQEAAMPVIVPPSTPEAAPHARPKTTPKAPVEAHAN